MAKLAPIKLTQNPNGVRYRFYMTLVSKKALRI